MDGVARCAGGVAEKKSSWLARWESGLADDGEENDEKNRPQDGDRTEEESGGADDHKELDQADGLTVSQERSCGEDDNDPEKPGAGPCFRTARRRCAGER